MKGTIYYQVFREVYQLMNKHYGSGDYDQMLDDADDLAKKYKDTDAFIFVKALLVAILQELERIHNKL